MTTFARRVLPALLALALVAPAAASAAVPPGDGGGGGGNEVHSLKPWKADRLYRIERDFKVRSEESPLARQTGTLVLKKSYLPIACQVWVRNGTKRVLWNGVAQGFVSDQAMKTYSDGRLKGSPTCRLPQPEHVWGLERWSQSKEYRINVVQTPQREPKLGTGLGTVVRGGQFVRIACQTKGQKVRGSRIWNRVSVGGYIPDSTMKTFTDGYIKRAPRCKGTQDDTPPKFVSLGDSYSSGLGGDGYFQRDPGKAWRLLFTYDYFKSEPAGRSGDGKDCSRNTHAYPRRLAGRLKTSLKASAKWFMACQGDTTKEVLQYQIPQIPSNARVITMTIGGNDLGFSSIVQACALLTKNCSDAVRKEFGSNGQGLAEFGHTLDLVYTRIRAKAPYATVLIGGYPKLFQPAKDLRGCGDISDDDGKLLNSAGAALNTTISQAVGRHQGFRFVGFGNAFKGHGPCQDFGPKVWVNPVTVAGNRKPFSMHPNLKGQGVYTDAFAKAAPDLFR